jgi:hypothetical protein
MGQQFFEGQAVLGPVMAEGEFIDVGIGGRVVQVADRIGQRRQLVVAGQFGRQPVGQAARAEQVRVCMHNWRRRCWVRPSVSG